MSVAKRRNKMKVWILILLLSFFTAITHGFTIDEENDLKVLYLEFMKSYLDEQYNCAENSEGKNYYDLLGEECMPCDSESNTREKYHFCSRSSGSESTTVIVIIVSIISVLVLCNGVLTVYMWRSSTKHSRNGKANDEEIPLMDVGEKIAKAIDECKQYINNNMEEINKRVNQYIEDNNNNKEVTMEGMTNITLRIDENTKKDEQRMEDIENNMEATNVHMKGINEELKNLKQTVEKGKKKGKGILSSPSKGANEEITKVKDLDKGMKNITDRVDEKVENNSQSIIDMKNQIRNIDDGTKKNDRSIHKIEINMKNYEIRVQSSNNNFNNYVKDNNKLMQEINGRVNDIKTKYNNLSLGFKHKPGNSNSSTGVSSPTSHPWK